MEKQHTHVTYMSHFYYYKKLTFTNPVSKVPDKKAAYLNVQKHCINCKAFPVPLLSPLYTKLSVLENNREPLELVNRLINALYIASQIGSGCLQVFFW